MTQKMKGKNRKKQGGGIKCSCGTRIENCKSKKHSGALAQAGELRSSAMYNINNTDIFVQVKKGESLGRIISLEM